MHNAIRNWASAQIKAVLKGLGVNISISLNRGNLKKLYLDYVNNCFNYVFNKVRVLKVKSESHKEF
jgi:hypothetical protein